MLGKMPEQRSVVRSKRPENTGRMDARRDPFVREDW